MGHSEKRREINLIEGPIFSRLITFAMPMIAGNILQQIYNLVDTLVVGTYLGAKALAAVGSSYTLMVFITSIIIGLCMGNGALFSMDYGAGDEKQLRQDVWLSFAFVSVVTVVIYVVLFWQLNNIHHLLRVPVELIELMNQYISVIFMGIVFVFLYNYFSFLLRSMGNSMIPLAFLASSSIINVVLDVWFIVGLGFGVEGAALATVIAQAVSGLGVMLYSMVSLPLLKLDREFFVWDFKRLKEIVVNDMATSMQQSVMNFGILMIQGLVNSFGTTIMAAFAIVVKIDTIAYMPAQEFSNAYSLFISQNYGAKKQDRIRKGTKIAIATSFTFCVVISILIFTFARELMGLFIDGSETALIAEGVRYLHIEGAMYIGIGILFLWYAYFRGISRPHISLVLTIVSLGTRVLLSYALAPNTPLGVVAIWYSIPIGWFLADITGALFYRKYKLEKELK